MPRSTASPMTSTEVCRQLGVSPKSLYLWERARKIPAPARDRRGWRAYSPAQVAAIRNFVGRGAPAPASRPPAPRRGSGGHLDGLSARNQLRGRVIAMRGDRVLCEVTVRLGDGQEIVAVVTRSSARRLGLRIGGDATAIIKSTEVMLFR